MVLSWLYFGSEVSPVRSQNEFFFGVCLSVWLFLFSGYPQLELRRAVDP